MKEDKAIAQTVFSALGQAHDEAGQQAVIDSLMTVLRRTGNTARGYRIMTVLQGLFDAAEGIITATVTTAQPLSDQQKEGLQAKLQAQHAASGLTIHYMIDPQVLGGMSVRISDMLYDDTLKRKLFTLANTLTH